MSAGTVGSVGSVGMVGSVGADGVVGSVADDTAGRPAAGDPLLRATNLRKTFGNGVRAVVDVDVAVDAGETVGVVGESGCGKSTTARVILRLLERDSGTISFAGENLGEAGGTALRRLRARLQIVPQNPQTSLNPRLRVRDSIEFNLRAHGLPRLRRRDRVVELLDQVGLVAAYAERYPHELSGGQLQRVAIARALATSPELVVCDEAVSALDKSIQAQILNLLADLQDQLGVAYLFISHDLAVVEHLSDRVMVMYLGRVVEEGTAAELWANPMHPYTRALLSAVPGAGRERIVLRGDPPSPTDPPSGCRFRTRCPDAIDACATEQPLLADLDRTEPSRSATTGTVHSGSTGPIGPGITEPTRLGTGRLAVHRVACIRVRSAAVDRSGTSDPGTSDPGKSDPGTSDSRTPAGVPLPDPTRRAVPRGA